MGYLLYSTVFGLLVLSTGKLRTSLSVMFFLWLTRFHSSLPHKIYLVAPYVFDTRNLIPLLPPSLILSSWYRIRVVILGLRPVKQCFWRWFEKGVGWCEQERDSEDHEEPESEFRWGEKDTYWRTIRKEQHRTWWITQRPQVCQLFIVTEEVHHILCLSSTLVDMSKKQAIPPAQPCPIHPDTISQPQRMPFSFFSDHRSLFDSQLHWTNDLVG